MDVREMVCVIQAYINHTKEVTPDINLQSAASNFILTLDMYQKAISFFQTDPKGSISWIN